MGDELEIELGSHLEDVGIPIETAGRVLDIGVDHVTGRWDSHFNWATNQ
jgi:hypothetical protein